MTMDFIVSGCPSLNRGVLFWCAESSLSKICLQCNCHVYAQSRGGRGSLLSISGDLDADKGFLLDLSCSLLRIARSHFDLLHPGPTIAVPDLLSTEVK